MSINNEYNRIKSKISEDKILNRYNETKNKLINEGYKPTEDKVLQRYNETRMKLISEGYKTTAQIDKETTEINYNQYKSRSLNSLGEEDRETLKIATYAWFGAICSIGFILFLIVSSS